MSRSLILFNKKGTFLIEALLTITIMAVSLTLITRSFVAATKASAYVSEYTQAEFEAENIMFDFIKDGLPSKTGKNSGGKFSYQFDVKPLKGGQELNELSLQIMWPSGGKTRHVSLMTYLPANPI